MSEMNSVGASGCLHSAPSNPGGDWENAAFAAGSRSPAPERRQGGRDDGAALDARWNDLLVRDVARMAGRLREHLARTLSPVEGPLAAGLAFLAGAYDAEFKTANQARSVERNEDADRAQPTSASATSLDRLVSALGLTECERELVVLAGMPDEHEGFADVFRSIHPNSQPRATVGLAAQLLCRDAGSRWPLRRVLECGAATKSGLVRLVGDAPFFTKNVVLADDVWSVLRGIDAWPACVEHAREAAPLFGLGSWLDSAPAMRARAALANRARCTILLLADDEDVPLSRAVALVSAAGLDVTPIQLPAEPTTECLQLICVHCAARGTVPALRLALSDGPARLRFPDLSGFPGPVVACSTTPRATVRGSRPVLGVPCERLTIAAHRDTWSRTLPQLADSAPLLSARYPLEPVSAQRTARDVELMARLQDRPCRAEDVGTSLRTRAGLAVGGGVRVMQPAAAWEHLVLPEESVRQLRDAVDRVVHQSRVLEDWRFLEGRPGARGVRMLFCGPSGTGKTLSAEVLANALRADLLLVDLSRVVSKWIGETEKNLSDVFDAAERTRAVLFFDEADALFGRRTDVSDAHDRYANLETAYLLTRLERFDGLAILATNLRQNLDPAFTRRLEFILEFDEPARAERVRLWRAHVPPEAPIAADVCFEELAGRFRMVGGLIRNAAVAAAFLAASEGGSISRDHLIRSVRREYEKNGKPFPGLARDSDKVSAT